MTSTHRPKHRTDKVDRTPAGNVQSAPRIPTKASSIANSPEADEATPLSAAIAQNRPGTFSPQQILGLQRALGNQAVMRMLKKNHSMSSSIARKTTKKGVVQRAVGFEFEFGKWQTTHNDDEKTRLTKGEEIIKGKGYKIEGEDAENGSAIEVVTKPYTTSDEAVQSVTEAQTKLQGMHTAGEDIGHPASTWGGSENVTVTPKGDKGKMQASPAIALDKIPALYAKQAALGGGKSKALGENVQGQVDSLKTKYLNDQDASPELIGLVTLIVDYLEQGSGKGQLSYPKSAYKLMARTAFNKMFELVPEYAFFAKKENIEKWVGLVLEVSANIFGNEFYDEVGTMDIDVDVQVPKTFLTFKSIFGKKLGTKTKKVKQTIPWNTRKSRPKTVEQMGSEPVLGQKLGDMEALPGDEPVNENDPKPNYQMNITREQWLRNMTEEDLISKENDKRFEGMGAYGGSTDVEVINKDTEKAAENAVSELGLTDLPKPPETENQQQDQEKKPKQAPIFEFRGLRDMFGIDQDVTLANWEEKVKAVFAIVDEVNGGSFKAGGKPDIAPDTDNTGIWDKV